MQTRELVLSSQRVVSTWLLLLRVKRKVDVYTGTHGFLKYPDTNTLDEKSIFLYTEDGHEWIPTPNFFWKVIHDKEKGQAMAFIGERSSCQLSLALQDS